MSGDSVQEKYWKSSASQDDSIKEITEDSSNKEVKRVEEFECADLSSDSQSEENFNEINFADVNDIITLGECTEEEYDALPSFTIRMSVIAVVVSAVITAIDIFFSMRFPAISIGPIVAQMVSYPMGVAWAKIMPNWKIKVWKDTHVYLNPGPFNKKEHTLIYIFCNTSMSTGLLYDLVIEQYKFFDLEVGIGRMILFNVMTFLWSWGLAGLCMPILIYPKQMMWPSVLGPCALFETLHVNTSISVPNWKVSRFRFLVYAFTGSFVLYWLSDLVIPFITYIGAFISWCKPSSAVLAQVFGTKSGLGLFPVTFSWPEITNLSNPLQTPFWAISNIYGSFFFWVLVILPACYYSNQWQTAHLPMLSNGIFNSSGKSYVASSVVNSSYRLDVEKYTKYSPVFLPIGFILKLCLGVGAFAAMMTQFFWRFKTDVIGAFKALKRNRIAVEPMPHMSKLHWGYYVFILMLALCLGFVFFYAWEDRYLSGGGYIVSCIIGVIIVVPTAMIEGKSSFTLAMDSFLDVVGSKWFAGDPIAVMFFYETSFGFIQHFMHMQQDLKLCTYTRTDLKRAMVVLLLASVWGSVMASAITYWYMFNIHGVCTTDAKDNLTCKSVKTQYNTHLIWGLFGEHIFGAGGRYTVVLWFFLVGAGVTGATIAMQKIRPNAKFWKQFSPALFMGGAQSIPTSTGINYHSWFIVGFIFNYYIHKYKTLWWRKYNLVLAVAMDCGVAIAAIIVYFAVVYPGGSANYNWWGTEVFAKGCDSTGCPYESSASIQKPSGIW